jgi:hypothetical protein
MLQFPVRDELAVSIVNCYLLPCAACLYECRFMIMEAGNFPYERLDSSMWTILFISAAMAFSLNVSRDDGLEDRPNIRQNNILYRLH